MYPDVRFHGTVYLAPNSDFEQTKKGETRWTNPWGLVYNSRSTETNRIVYVYIHTRMKFGRFWVKESGHFQNTLCLALKCCLHRRTRCLTVPCAHTIYYYTDWAKNVRSLYIYIYIYNSQLITVLDPLPIFCQTSVCRHPVYCWQVLIHYVFFARPACAGILFTAACHSLHSFLLRVHIYGDLPSLCSVEEPNEVLRQMIWNVVFGLPFFLIYMFRIARDTFLLVECTICYRCRTTRSA